MAHAARGPITGITLMAGFASTVGWPLTALGLDHIGWRNTCFAWAAAHILIGLPINFFMLPKVAGAKAAAANAVKPHIPIDRTMILLAFAFAAGWTVTGAMAAHMPRILEAGGATAVQAVAAGALFGPAQVFARILEASFLSRYHPLVSTRLACLTHPIGAAIFAVVGGAASGAFAIFFGMGNGILTIARGTLPLAIFGPKDYGYRLGLIGAPARMAQAMAPLAFGLLIDLIGIKVLIVSSALSLSALVALCLLRPQGFRARPRSYRRGVTRRTRENFYRGSLPIQARIASATASGCSGIKAWLAFGITTTETRSPNSSRISFDMARGLKGSSSP